LIIYVFNDLHCYHFDVSLLKKYIQCWCCSFCADLVYSN